MITPAEIERARRSPGEGQAPRVVKGPTVRAIEPNTGDRFSQPIDCHAFNAVHLHCWPSTAGASATVQVTGSGHQGPPWMLLPGGSRPGLTDMLAFTVPIGCPWCRVELVNPSGLWTVEATPLIASGMPDGALGVAPSVDVGTPQDVAVGAPGAAATVTYPAVVGLRHGVSGFLISYSAAPTGGRLTVLDGATTILDLDVTAAGPTPIALSRSLAGSINTAMTITLAGGGGAVVGKLTVLGHDTYG